MLHLDDRSAGKSGLSCPVDSNGIVNIFKRLDKLDTLETAADGEVDFIRRHGIASVLGGVNGFAQ